VQTIPRGAHPDVWDALDRCGGPIVWKALRALRRDASPLALLLLNLNRFKDINDTFGHHYGDLLLQRVGDRLRDVLREADTVARLGEADTVARLGEADTVARLGGDEFAILLPSAPPSGPRGPSRGTTWAWGSWPRGWRTTPPGRG